MMDKLLALCHFCELHGPSVILCTHWVSESDINDLNWFECDTRTQSFSSYGTSLGSASNQPISEIRIDGRDVCNDCDGCSLKSKSMGNAFNGFLSYDSDKKYGYVTSGQPFGDSFRQITPSMTKEACVRSLSCEVYEKGREGVVYFGDDMRAHVLSYLFVLRDSKARGFQRTYSICVINLNKQQLLRDWEFLVQHIERVINKLKEKARVVYESELTQTTCQQRRSLILDNVTNIGTNAVLSTNGEDFEPRNALNTQRSNSKARSLLELTGDDTTFAIIHSQFSWILHALRSQYTKGCDDVFDSCSDEWYLPSLNSISKSVPSLRHYYKIVGRDLFRQLALNIVIGHQIIICHSNRFTLKFFIFGLSQLIPDECINAKTYSDVYDERWNYNFIGVPDIKILPISVLESRDHLIVILEEKSKNKSSIDNEDECLDNLRVCLRTKQKLPEKLPNFLTSIERVLADVSFSDTCFDAYVMSLKQEWLNKVHTIYGFTKNRNRSVTDINLLMKALNIEEWDRKLTDYWLHFGLSIEFKAKVFAINSNETVDSI